MITVHHLRNSQSERVVWLCEELNLDYRLKIHERRSDNRLAPNDYKALHGVGTAPVVVDDGFVIAESGAICDYLNYRYGGGALAPNASHADYPDHLFWFHWSNASYMAALSIERVLAMTGGSAPAFIVDRVRRSQMLIENRPSGAPYFGGSALSTADIMMLFCLTTMRGFTGGSLSDMPATREYLARIGARPAYRRAMEKAEGGRTIAID
ncbi:glutathione S-transferase family protein [Sphingomonas sp. AX6]|uniref:glutathione S-transferase family protein n=1 Tax=Sphingomonas sp. AX6 TaxID=2653171 RepID=UPI0012F27B28|nr:glutathione S-transferase [Sphingomonas sp. AX6]VXC85044.1 Glutathione S-transferase [Sphingomonas sp. AX6]